MTKDEQRELTEAAFPGTYTDGESRQVDVLLTAAQRKDLDRLLRLYRQELINDLENNDYSKTWTIEASKNRQINEISLILKQLSS